MPKLRLNPEELTVETFPTSPIDGSICKPTLTRDPGCTLPELCGTG